MPAAIAIPLIVGGATAATTVATAKMGSNAANRAANTQLDATNRAADLQSQAAKDALAFQREQFDYAKQSSAPYQQIGTQALGTLSNLMGFQGGAPATAGGPPTLGSGPTLQGLGTSTYTAPDMVLMRAPNGQTRPVPKAMVQHYAQRGATVIQ